MYNVGIDLGGTNIAVGVVDENFNIVGRANLPTNAQRPADDIIKDMATAVELSVKDAGLSMSDISSCGIAAPGNIDLENGVVVYANNLPFNNLPLVEKLQDILKTKVYIANDANAAAYGEFLAGAGKGTKDFIMITLGTGVGGGIIINEKLYTGFNGGAGELGHMVICQNGVQCTCGTKGCLEAYASATALINQTKDAMQNNKESALWTVAEALDEVNGKTAFDGMRLGDAVATKVVDDYIGYLACGISSFINIFQPEVFCIGGGVCHEKDNLVIPLKEKIAKADYNKMPKKTTLVIAKLQNDAGIVGAAMLYKL